MKTRELLLKQRVNKGKGRTESTLSLSFGDTDNGVRIQFADPESEAGFDLDTDDVNAIQSFLDAYLLFWDDRRKNREYGYYEEEG